MALQKEYDVVIVGAGVLGSAIAYELSLTFGGSIAVIEKENGAGLHTSTRNTGVIHRPFYMEPEKKKLFAESSQISYRMWKALAVEFDLPWKENGTLEIATRETDLKSIDSYAKWAITNGMQEEEFKILGSSELKEHEPLVKGYGAILSITDSCVDFGSFTSRVMELAKSNGVEFISGSRVIDAVETPEGIRIKAENESKKIVVKAGLMINSSGGDSLPLAHKMHLAKKYAVLNFRGDYWVVGDSYPGNMRNNIYTVPKHKKFPFLDPHFILRVDGRRELGPNAALVATPYDYSDQPDSGSLMFKLLERPTLPKIKLLTNSEFLSLVRSEWKSSRSKDEMARRVREFIPGLDTSYISGKGLSGVRNSLIDSGGFVPEAVMESSDHSIHILNYNSPGATGAPAFALHVIRLLNESGKITLKETSSVQTSVWRREVGNLL